MPGILTTGFNLAVHSVLLTWLITIRKPNEHGTMVCNLILFLVIVVATNVASFIGQSIAYSECAYPPNKDADEKV